MRAIIPSLVFAATITAQSPVEVASPDGRVVIRFALRNGVGEKARATYNVSFNGHPLLLESGLGLTFEGHGRWGSGLTIRTVRHARHSGSWRPVYGERSEIPDSYAESIIELEEIAGPRRRVNLALRAYNEGAAFRYLIPVQPGMKDFVIASEESEFHSPHGTRAWETHGAQQQYENVWTKDLQRECERPLVIEYPEGMVAALAEAGVRDYARMLFSPAPGRPGVLVSELSGGAPPGAEPDPGGSSRSPSQRATSRAVWGRTPFSTPWRVIIAGNRPGDLIERNYLLLNLNEPSKIPSHEWIRPGKVIREVTLSTKGAKECIDFARARNLQFVEFDAGWYGHEYSDRSDARGANVDPLRLQRDPAYRGLDLQESIRYAREKGIGVWLYVNRRALERQLPTILPLYERLGIQGVKFGFVNVGSQYWTKWLYDAVELAAKHHLMVDIHDEHRPTGLSRTWPNLLTQEGILGNEGMPPPQHNTILPFTRFVAGAGDYTICYYSDRIKTTRAHQLALAVVAYSPLQFLYWYDRPSAYQGEPETEFFDKVPTVWDETKVIDGEIGRFVSIARRSGGDWFIGTINNGVPRRVKLPLRFLPPGRKFTAHLYENGRGPRDVAMSNRVVDSSAVLEAVMPGGGGQAVWLETIGLKEQRRILVLLSFVNLLQHTGT
jgi:alpha-glucosidase